jgi:hypothetical protein
LIDQIHAWLDQNRGADGWAITPSGMRGVINDAVAICFRDAALASAFVARWCAGSAVDVDDRVREDQPAARSGAGLHKTF